MKIVQIKIVYATIPFIILDTDEVITATGTQSVQIEFNELGAYIRNLTAQQTLLGKYVSFSKGIYTFNQNNFDSVVIAASDTPGIVIDPLEVSITLDGVNLTLAEALAPLVYCEAGTDPLYQLNTFIDGSIFYIKLPYLNIDDRNSFDADYNYTGQQSQDDVMVSALSDGAGNWDVYFCFNKRNLNFTIVTNDYVLFQYIPGTGQEGAGALLSLFNEPYYKLVEPGVDTKISRGQFSDNFFNFEARVTNNYGFFTVKQYEGVTLVATSTYNPAQMSIPVFSGIVDKVTIQLSTFTLTNNAVNYAFIALNNNAQGKYWQGIAAGVPVSGAFLQKGNTFLNTFTSNALGTYNVSIYAGGVLVNDFGAAVYGVINQFNTAGFDFDEVRLTHIP